MDFKLLDFDTKLFGFGVAKILSARLSSADLLDILNELREKKVRLVFWPADSTDDVSERAAESLGGFFGSKHITYLIDLEKLNPAPVIAPEIEPYSKDLPDDDLQQLAFYAGTYSHFNTDPDFPKELFHKLYREWIKNSVNKSVATEVLVAQDAGKNIGMITLGEKDGRGDIGLLGVDSEFRGRQLGTKLVRSAQAYFIKEGLSHAQVVTQKENIPACRLYEKCGFVEEKTENFYHFWL